jgi:predicted RecA/RadA family phage recombinase
MPALYLATGRVAGDECSSTYEGRHLTLEESYLTHPVHGDGFVNKGDPVNVGFNIVGVALNDAVAATDLIAIDTEGIWFLDVVASNDAGVSDVAVGDQLYLATGVVSKKASGIPFGESLGTLTGSASAAVCAVKVHGESLHADSNPIVHQILIAAGALGDTDLVLSQKTKIIDAWLVLRGAGVATTTLTLKNGATAITDAMAASGSDKAVVRCTTLDDAQWEIAAGGTLRVTSATGATQPAATVFALGVRVD